MAEYSTPSLPSIPLLVGREREQATLRAALEAAQAGRGSLVLIGGEAGIGKTALAEDLLAEAASRGARVLVGRCYDLSETPPYGPWRELFDRAPRDGGLPTLPAAVLPTEVAGDELRSQEAITGRVRAYLIALSARTPVVLLLDDVHWADPASLDLLRAVARGLGTLPALVLAAYRADELTRRHPLAALLPALEREARAARLDLRPLGEAALRALVGRYALPPADAARLVAWLVGRAEGNAFFTAQLLRALEDGGVLRHGDDGWALGDPEAVGLPMPLRQVLDTRVDRLGEAARDLLALAAVLGQEVPLATWAAVAGTDEEALLDAVERAVDAHLLVALPDGDAVRFAHALVREALYAGMLPLRRRRLHLRAADALLATAQPDPDAVASHLQRAGDPRAGRWLERAGERAHRAYAWATAAARFEAALASLGEDGPADETRRLLLLRLAILRRVAAPVQAIDYLDEAARLAERAGDAPLLALATFYRGLLRCIAGAWRRGLAELAAGVAALEALPPAGAARLRALRAALYLGAGDERGTLASQLAGAGRYAEALAEGERAAAAPDPAAPVGYGTSSHADAHLALLWARAARGEPAAARRAYERGRDLYRAVGHHLNVGHIAHYALVCLALPYHADDPAWCRALADEADAAFRRAGEVLPGFRPGLGSAPLLFVQGGWAALAALGEHAGAGARMVPVGRGECARARGDAAAAWHLARAAVPGGLAAEPGDSLFPAAAAGQRLAAALALDAGDLPVAHAWLEAHDRWLAWSGAVLWQADGALGWAAYHRAAGEFAEERAQAEQAVRGELDTGGGQHAAARGHLDAAIALAVACAAPYERALCLLALTELQLATGERERAVASLTEARALLAPLAAAPALARADALAARLAAPVSVAAALPFGLTAREAEVLRLVAQGLGNAEVGARLFLSPRTVQQHLRAVYNKLGVDNRAAATRLAVEHRLA